MRLQRGRRQKKLTADPALRFALQLARSMGCTLHELAHVMTAQEFGLHEALAAVEPLPPGTRRAIGQLLAALANGPLKPPDGRNAWAAADFLAPLWQPPEAAAAPQPPQQTVEQIMAAARAVGLST